jgi:hypothetical protein
MYPTVHPRGKVQELFKKDMNRAVEKLQIRLKPAEKGKRGRKRKRLPDRIPEKKNQKNQNKLKSALSEKPNKSGRGRPRKRVSFKNSEQSDDEADAAPRIRTKSGGEVKRPRRD